MRGDCDFVATNRVALTELGLTVAAVAAAADFVGTTGFGTDEVTVAATTLPALGTDVTTSGAGGSVVITVTAV